MRHGNKIKKLGLKRNPRRALLRSLALSLIARERITTTETRAKELKKQVEPLVTISKKSGLSAIRILSSKLGNQSGAVKKLTTVIGKRYQDRAGGYTRVVKLPPRKSDGAKMAIIEFV